MTLTQRQQHRPCVLHPRPTTCLPPTLTRSFLRPDTKSDHQRIPENHCFVYPSLGRRVLCTLVYAGASVCVGKPTSCGQVFSKNKPRVQGFQKYTALPREGPKYIRIASKQLQKSESRVCIFFIFQIREEYDSVQIQIIP